ncbi:MAG: OsmC family protein [Flavobacteriales bacterium]|nr:OsmC family protein [Flavobacteriales bacterium]
MKIRVERQDGLFHFVGKDNNGTEIHMDAAEKIGGTDKGVRPMQMLLYGIAGCSGIDVVSILNKQKQTLDDIAIDIEAEREEGKIPSLFTKINVHYTLKGNLDENKVKRALELTFTKYCSVSKIIEKTAEITYSYSIEN